MIINNSQKLINKKNDAADLDQDGEDFTSMPNGLRNPSQSTSNRGPIKSGGSPDKGASFKSRNADDILDDLGDKFLNTGNQDE